MAIKKDFLIYVVEDNKMYNHLVTAFLKKKDFTNVKSFYTGTACLKALKNGEFPDVVIQDYFLEEMNGIDVLRRVKKISPKTEFIFLTGNESMEVAVNSIKFGAYDYVIKDNVALEKVLDKIQKISKLFKLLQRNRQIRKSMVLFLVGLLVIVIFSILYFVVDIFGVN
ncbi:MAG: response regulator [Prolixibacteraceae bacterium]|jgi:DNA-binding NtrC family response regulator|nr:response regulator [Prolixibacteraceae bacterium]MBT7000146.1 response regulator [Prolixibacteraceae bacterium]MBT7397218.1 response regulator [Prolixibacteraceae bacterium]